MFSGKTLLITGGTGSFGNAVLRHFIKTDIEEIRIFSRDEKKQDDMRKHYQNSRLKFYLGDVRDSNSVDSAMKGVDYVFHAAALKQVPSCEFYPMQAVKTNILGTENVLNMAVTHKVQKVICLSTDKAVYPINAMGMSKALMEKVMVASSRGLEKQNTVICGTRYGNVMASRGSVIPLFIDQILSGKPMTITDPKMTRFIMALDEAVELVLYAFKHGKNGDLFVKKAPATNLQNLANAVRKFMKHEDHEIAIIGTRHGEKLYETLMTREEMARAEDLGDYYKIYPDSRDLNYEIYFEQGENLISKMDEYHSHNTKQLTENEMIEILKHLHELKDLKNLS